MSNWYLRIVLLATLALGACTSEPPPVPPAELKSTTSEISFAKLWSSDVGEADRGRFEPLIDGNNLYAANADGGVSSLAVDTGKRQWKSDLDVRLTSGISGDAGQLYVSDIDGVVHALAESSGELLWSAKGSSEILTPAAAGFGTLVVRSTDGRVISLDPESGDQLWTVSNPPPALTLNGYSRPLVLDGGVLIGLDDGRLLALNSLNGKPIWETVVSVPSGRSEVERLVDIDADIVIDDDGIYLANFQGKAVRIEPARGQIVWSTPMSAGSGIAVNNDSFIVVDDKDTVHRLDKMTGSILWSNDEMPGRRLSPPAFTPDNNIVLGDTEGYLHVLDLGTGVILGRTRLDKEAIVARPYASGDAVYVQSTGGKIAAYRVAR